jgi:molybdenum cofactor guanylyltransferase
VASAINEQHPHLDQIAGVVLAGGRATRMGGQDKGLIPIDGLAMIVRICKLLRPQVASLLINANRNQARYAELVRCPVIDDHIGHFAGPLAGMAAALNYIHLPYLVAVPCDSPFLAPDLVTRLYLALRQQQAEIAMAMFEGKPQPVFVLLSRHLLPSLTLFLETGGHKIIDWYYQHRVAEVDFSDRPQMFENINTPQEQDRIEQLMRQAQ